MVPFFFSCTKKSLFLFFLFFFIASFCPGPPPDWPPLPPAQPPFPPSFISNNAPLAYPLNRGILRGSTCSTPQPPPSPRGAPCKGCCRCSPFPPFLYSDILSSSIRIIFFLIQVRSPNDSLAPPLFCFAAIFPCRIFHPPFPRRQSTQEPISLLVVPFANHWEAFPLVVYFFLNTAFLRGIVFIYSFESSFPARQESPFLFLLTARH